MNKKIQYTPKNGCWFFHRWQTMQDTGATLYQECKKCPARIGINYLQYQPINRRWVFREAGATVFPPIIAYKKQVSRAEVSELLRGILTGKYRADSLENINWWDVNEPFISVEGWEIQFFIEANWIYDVYAAYAPDGRQSDFNPRDNDSDIELFLSDDEVDQLRKKLGFHEKKPTNRMQQRSIKRSDHEQYK